MGLGFEFRVEGLGFRPKVLVLWGNEGLGFRAEGPGRAFEGLGGRLELSRRTLGRRTSFVRAGIMMSTALDKNAALDSVFASSGQGFSRAQGVSWTSGRGPTYRRPAWRHGSELSTGTTETSQTMLDSDDTWPWSARVFVKAAVW